MKLNLLTYADELYAPMQAKLVEHARELKVFDEIYARNRNELIQTSFYNDNQHILDVAKGGGLCAWKPYFILETLKQMDDGDILLYMDSADWIGEWFEYSQYNHVNIKERVLGEMSLHEMLLTAGAFPNKYYTKRDAFVYMGCDTEEYHNAIQIEAGVMLLKKSEYTKKILLEWQKWCCVANVINDEPNICNLPNLDGFVGIRYDQSILSLIAKKNNIIPSDFIRKFVTCNVNNPI